MKEIVTRMLTVKEVWYVELITVLSKVDCNGIEPMTAARSLNIKVQNVTKTFTFFLNSVL